jgi:hypothetical protein
MPSPLVNFHRFTADYDQDLAVQSFERRYGVKPERVERVTIGGCEYLDLGPIPDNFTPALADMEAPREHPSL